MLAFELDQLHDALRALQERIPTDQDDHLDSAWWLTGAAASHVLRAWQVAEGSCPPLTGEQLDLAYTTASIIRAAGDVTDPAIRRNAITCITTVA
jgi:hypothetical protein